MAVFKLNTVFTSGIGTIILPDLEMDSDVIAILANYTKAVTNKQKYALNSFVLSCKEAGIWAKINKLYLPFFASTITEALFDAKGLIATSSLVNAVSLSTTGYVLDAFGLKSKEWVSGTTDATTYLEYSSSFLNSNSFHIATAIGKIERTLKSKMLSTIPTANVFVYANMPLSIQLGSSPSIKAVSSQTLSKSLITNGSSPVSAETDLAINVDGVLTSTKTMTGTYVNPNVAAKKLYVAHGGFNEYTYNNKYSVALQAFGSELTAEEITLYNTAITSFVDSILA